jgi:hypothetical protein
MSVPNLQHDGGRPLATVKGVDVGMVVSIGKIPGSRHGIGSGSPGASGRGREAGNRNDQMDNLVSSGFVRLADIPYADVCNRATWDPVTLSRPDCTARLNNLTAGGHDSEETTVAVETWPRGDA